MGCRLDEDVCVLKYHPLLEAIGSLYTDLYEPNSTDDRRALKGSSTQPEPHDPPSKRSGPSDSLTSRAAPCLPRPYYWEQNSICHHAPGRFWNLLVLDADTGRNMDSSCRSGPPSLSPRQLLVP
jgi:hypothetical protein